MEVTWYKIKTRGIITSWLKKQLKKYNRNEAFINNTHTCIHKATLTTCTFPKKIYFLSFKLLILSVPVKIKILLDILYRKYKQVDQILDYSTL